VGSHEVEVQRRAVKILGVWVDPKLSWGVQAEHAARKGDAAVTAIQRIAASTWGPGARSTRLLYTAVAKPAMLYGAPEWANREAGKPLARSRLGALEKVQNRALRVVTGGYKRTPRAALEREAEIPPIDLEIEAAAKARAYKTRNDPVERMISDTATQIWHTFRGRRRTAGPRPPTAREAQASTLPHQWSKRTWLRGQWEARWRPKAERAGPEAAPVWTTPWE